VIATAAGSVLTHRFDAAAFATGGRACKPRILGIGADSGNHEQRSPSTRVATDARGVTVDLPRIDRPAGVAARAEHSSKGVPPISAPGIVGDHSMSRLADSCSFHRSMTAFASARGGHGNLPPCINGYVQPPCPHSRCRSMPGRGRQSIPGGPPRPRISPLGTWLSSDTSLLISSMPATTNEASDSGALAPLLERR
jgi:hypothetical protein